MYLTIDPIKDNNKLLNKLMIEFDKVKFIRNVDSYKEIMKEFNYLITDDFFKMSLKKIFHYKNIELKKNLLKIQKNSDLFKKRFFQAYYPQKSSIYLLKDEYGRLININSNY